MSRLPHALLLLALLPAPAWAQAGLYRCVGTDAALGPYQGQVELRDTGAGAFDYVRLVTYQTPLNGKTLTTAWIGRAVSQGADLNVLVNLRRLDFVTAWAGLQRTRADNTPLAVTGTYRPDPAGGLAGQLGASGVSASEALTRLGPPGASPLFQEQVSFRPLHGAPPAFLKSLLFGLFSNYFTLPTIAPYTSRPEFQAAVHRELRDRTGFTWLRAHPGELLLTNKLVDAISLEEGELRRSAYGLRLYEKAAGFDHDAEGRLLDVTGLLPAGVRQTPQGPQIAEDMSTWLWSACYAYGQACRWKLTHDPQAQANLLRLARVFCDMVEIDPRPGEFARSLRPIGRGTISGSWHAGGGAFSQLAYHDNGNNDMIKGFWLGFMAFWDAIPQNHALRPRIQACVRELADHWITANPSAAGGTGHKRDSSTSRLLNAMLADYVTGDPKYERAWRKELRHPLTLLELASGGNVQAYGIADWSGTHLGVCTHIALVELGQRLHTRWTRLFRFAFRPAQHFLGRYYRSTLVWSVASAGYNGDAQARQNVLDGLQEFPYPKPIATIDRTLDERWCASPYPSLPWKMDWMTNPGRLQGLDSEPLFRSGVSNYQWRSSPLGKGHSGDMEPPGSDYLFAYWLARSLNVLAPGD